MKLPVPKIPPETGGDALRVPFFIPIMKITEAHLD
jgi:hypothetical protein